MSLQRRVTRSGKAAPADRPDGRGRRVALVCARFNAHIVEGLAAGALAELRACGVAASRIERLDVPGAFELPLGVAAAAGTGRFDAVVAVGAVVRGDTDHYEHVAREASSGLSRVCLDTGVPVGFGLLTVRRLSQAVARAAPGPDNKGAEAARAALAMAGLLDRLRRSGARRPAPRRAGARS